MRFQILLAALALIAAPQLHADADHLAAAINGSHRTPGYVERDRYRHPLKTLELFDVQPEHTVVEIWPGGGWYTEILAPYLREKGKLIAAHYDVSDTQADYRPGSRRRFEEKLAADPEVYDRVSVSSLMFDEASGEVAIPAAASGTADRVVTFRNAHGWYHRGTMRAAFAHFFGVLKPGGKLGIVQHMADPNQDWMSRNIGYIGRDYIIAEALKAGFELESEGYFNRNPLDTKRHERGVWQLPPTLRDVTDEEEKKRLLAVGESDRMTLVFIRP